MLRIIMPATASIPANLGSDSLTFLSIMNEDLCCHAHLVKMFRGDVHSAVKPADRPFVKVETVEHSLVAQRGKELILLNEWQAVEDSLTAIIEGQVKPIAIKGAGGCNPF